jgi:hypothetical protein
MKNKILMIVSFLAVALTQNSCLKDNVGMDWTSDLKGKMYAEVWKGGIATQVLSPVPDPVIFKFMVNIATDALPTSDITLTIAVNDDARVKYNEANKANYTLYPYIEVLNPTVVIKAGTRNAYVHVKVWNANTLSACGSYMAPISIMTATGGVIVSDQINGGSRLMNLAIACPYQGNYHAYGYFKHPTAASSRYIDMDKSYSTLTCKSVHGDLADLGPDYTMDLIVDESSTFLVGSKAVNRVTIIGYGAQVTEQINVGDDLITGATNVPFNYYDPSTKQFVLRYHYNNGAAWREIMETLTRI